MKFFATAPKGIPQLLITELKAIGALKAKEYTAGVSFQGSLETAYRVCLWSRLANRILLTITKIPARDPDELYMGVKSVPWIEHLDPIGSLAINFRSSKSNITHTHYGALKVKDAIVDYYRERYGKRPSIELKTPDVRVNIYVLRNEAAISIDLSGESLHQRGYRKAGVDAPLKENLAAAILIRSGWPGISRAGGGLIDPMCGSGTFPIEAALMASDMAPGLLRDYFGFMNWKGHRPDIWNKLIDEAEEREKKGIERLPRIAGYDSDPKAIKAALSNLENSGLKGLIHFEKRELDRLEPHGRMPEKGLVIVNPPYGERLGDLKTLSHLYADLGKRLKNHFKGWKASVLLTNMDLGKSIGIRAYKKYTFYNGALECKLLNFDIEKERYVPEEAKRTFHSSGLLLNPRTDTEIEMFENRIRKNLRKLKGWLRSEDIHCYRLYDRDLPQYAVAIDVYEDFIHVQEYAPPKTFDNKKAEKRLNDILVVLPGLLNIPADHVSCKVRKQQKGNAQYNRFGSDQVLHKVREGGLVFLVNLSDYLDTGLFLDHRVTRSLIRELSPGKRFLNLFAYTGSATVCSAKGGAFSTVSVDFSKTYLDWARKNLAVNGYSGDKHALVQAEAVSWLEKEKNRYDLIFMDPPTFSNSKKLKNHFDIQRDHVSLIRKAVRLLDRDGILIFSTNFRRFRMDLESLKGLGIKDLSRDTLPFDFSRNPKIHKCWKITQQNSPI